jgi:hypothetical protein
MRLSTPARRPRSDLSTPWSLRFHSGIAKEARVQAEQMPAPRAKTRLLEIASTYERLAKLAEGET